MSTLTSVEAVAELIRAAQPADHRMIVGIVGAPGAGKSTIAGQLVAALTGGGGAAQGVALLPMDGFHLSQARLVELGRRERMGAADTFDVDGFIDTLERLAGIGARAHTGTDLAPATLPAPGTVLAPGTVFAPGFDREIEESVPDAIAITPDDALVIVEGNYLLFSSGGWERAAAFFDLTFFVDVDRDIRLHRLIERHERFGKTPADARAWSLGPDETNAVLINATAGRADHVIRL